MIVRVTFDEGHVMLFGDSYKRWHDQFREYIWRNRERLPALPVLVETSPSPWKSFGGLKWCPADTFQAQLNREGCQAGEPDNPDPRCYADMPFGPNRIASNIVGATLRRTKAAMHY